MNFILIDYRCSLTATDNLKWAENGYLMDWLHSVCYFDLNHEILVVLLMQISEFGLEFVLLWTIVYLFLLYTQTYNNLWFIMDLFALIMWMDKQRFNIIGFLIWGSLKEILVG